VLYLNFREILYRVKILLTKRKKFLASVDLQIAAKVVKMVSGEGCYSATFCKSIKVNFH
jgi:hypothetical protein